MLIFEHEGLLEVETQTIRQLSRSLFAVPFGEDERGPCEVQAVLCDYRDGSEERCRVVFHAKSLKSSLVFAVKNPQTQTPMEHGQQILSRLGFRFEEVNLKLSPAMQEVVLRDMPGLASRAEALKQRQDKAQFLDELQAAYDQDPDSAPGKKAALKLSAERRLQTRAQELRQHLEGLLAPAESAVADLEALTSQVKDLTARLKSATDTAEAERRQRKMIESITAAAEKRIQELEELLVDVETTHADALKHKRKLAQLQDRVKEMKEELEATTLELAEAREKQAQFIDDVKNAHQQIALLEKELGTSRAATDEQLVRLEEERSERARLEEALKESGLSLAAAQKALRRVERDAEKASEAVSRSADDQARLAEARQALQEALENRDGLAKDLEAARGCNEALTKALRQAEQEACDSSSAAGHLVKLTAENQRLAEEAARLRGEQEEAARIRKRLEKGSVADGKRIRELEAALSGRDASPPAEDPQGPVKPAAELEALQRELQEQVDLFAAERAQRETLEAELEESHKLIDSLGRALGEAEKVPPPHDTGLSQGEGGARVEVLEAKLRAVEDQLAQEQIQLRALAKALAVAEKQLAEQETAHPRETTVRAERRVAEPVVAEEPEAQPRLKSEKPLPHELRPAPAKGALFRPDWDLQGLPCRSADQVFKAWETAYNVQISLEGYPSQYCMAYLVVLRLGKQKKLCMLYRLKQSKHTLVCVPSKEPKDETSLKNAIDQGLQYLKMSGFEMESMSAEHVETALRGYFIGS